MTKPDDTMSWLFERQRLGMTLGLERVRALLAEMGSPQRSFRTVSVAGTNGKGSCSRAIAECLRAGGVTAGLYTSPHLSRLGERFVVRGDELGTDRVLVTLERTRVAAERLQASFFEILTVAACMLFEEEGVEIAVMEVGLGGRFDATNALEPELSIVTGISLDHVDLLGGDVRAIAREKAGVFRPGRLALTGAEGAALETLREEAALRGTPLWTVGDEIGLEGQERGWQGIDLRLSCPAGEVTASAPLVGAHQVRNLGLAAAASLVLGVAPSSIERGLSTTRWPGRLERVEYRGRYLVFDGAHNEAAAVALAGALRGLGAEPFTLVVGMGGGKDLGAFARELSPGAGSVWATRARWSPRAMPVGEVAAAFGDQAVSVDDPESALELAVEATGPRGTVVIAGSLHLVGELRSLVLNESFEPWERWQ